MLPTAKLLHLQGSKAKQAMLLSKLNDEEQEEVTVIFICDIPLLIITLIYRHFAIILYGPRQPSIVGQ